MLKKHHIFISKGIITQDAFHTGYEACWIMTDSSFEPGASVQVHINRICSARDRIDTIATNRADGFGICMFWEECGPTKAPTMSPTNKPTKSPTRQPTTKATTMSPTLKPTRAPSTPKPTATPSKRPTRRPRT